MDDPLILYSFVAGFALNAVIAAQMAYYWNAPSPKAKGKQKEVPVDAAPAAASTPTARRSDHSTTWLNVVPYSFLIVVGSVLGSRRMSIIFHRYLSCRQLVCFYLTMIPILIYV